MARSSRPYVPYGSSRDSAMSGTRSRRSFLGRDLPALAIGISATACGFVGSIAAEQRARRYVGLWTEDVESMRTPYPGTFDKPIVAVVEFRTSFHGGEFLPLIQVLEAAKPDVVALQGLRHDSSVIQSWNEGELFPHLMFNYYLKETEGRTFSVPFIKPPRRDSSLEELFGYMREKQIRLAGLEPTPEEAADALLESPGPITEERRQRTRVELILKTFAALNGAGMSVLTFTEFILLGRATAFLAPLLAVSQDWRRFEPDRIQEDPEDLFGPAGSRLQFFFEAADRYTIDGAFGDKVLPVLAMEHGAVQAVTEDFVFRLVSSVREEALTQEITRLRRTLRPLTKPEPILGFSAEHQLVTSVGGGIKGAPILF